MKASRSHATPGALVLSPLLALALAVALVGSSEAQLKGESVAPKSPVEPTSPTMLKPVPFDPKMRADLGKTFGALQAEMRKFKQHLEDLKKAEGKAADSQMKKARALLAQMEKHGKALEAGLHRASQSIRGDVGLQEVRRLLASFGTMKGKLEGKDRMGNFEIQDLMSQYNQAETLAGSVLKKKDDTGNAIIQKIG